MTTYHVRHRTTYAYSQPVEIGHSAGHLTPRNTPAQRVQSSTLVVTPQPGVMTRRGDYFGNTVTFFTVQERHEEVVVDSDAVVALDAAARPIEEGGPAWEDVAAALPKDRSGVGIDAYQYAFDSPFVRRGAALRDYALQSFTPARPIVDALRDLTGRIHRDFHYDPRTTTIATPLEEVFAQRSGVCQDFAHVQLAMLRSLGLAARYVSGYLYNPPRAQATARPTPPPPGEQLVGADASHAWLSLYCGAAGWVDADPTNNTLPGARHLTVAWGRDYADVTPLRGVILGGGSHTVTVAVAVALAG